uniref:Cas scaffold protein family member 4 n=1 Tax=Oryzias sinensis TaxID=183150 RepID=A0A8C7XHE7_9TELE
ISFQNKLAKALYDNTAECADELAFRKGDILTVLDQNVSGTSEWWRCLLYGRHGLAPANRLKLLPQPVATENSLNQETEQANDNGQNIYQIPSVPRVITNPNYDIPVPSSAELQHKTITGYSTLPNLRTPEWIYDVPAGLPRHSYNTLSPKTICSQPTDTNVLYSPLIKKNNPASSLYDIPKSRFLEVSSPPKLLSRVPSFEKPPTPQLNEEFVYDVPPRKEELTQPASDTSCGNQLLECRRDSSNTSELKRVCQQRIRNLDCMSFHGFSRSEELVVPERRRTLYQSSRDIQRISTASSSSSSSSTSSCDSLALSSSSPELLREVTLSPDEVGHKLLELQNSVVRAVPQLMVFVSSSWRHQEHLKKHLKEIKDAAELVSQSLLCFLNFTLDIKGNARRLTDTNLKTRLYKQLSIVEDSGVILQQTVRALDSEGWPLDKLCQDSGQVQTSDQLDRFVMVARTVPDDVMRLVSIINANGKLLFRGPQKSVESVSSLATGDAKKCSDANKQDEDSVEDNNDYVELEAKTEEKKPKEMKETEAVTPASKTVHNRTQLLKGFFFYFQIEPDDQHPSSDKGTEEHKKSPMSEHCRLYFGALQKAIVGFVGSVRDGQPPEKFISQSKLVIMVGQRLVDTLCREAQREKPNQTLLCKSNHLCALLKQLAVATKKAALHFPDKQALSEAQEFAKELAQRAQHFRISLDL